MHDSVMKILCDIGGTFARFALWDDGAPKNIKKVKACDFESFTMALAQYCVQEGVRSAGTLRIATAAYNDNGLWRFINDNAWIIDPKALEAEGWNIEIILNDFEATTWGLLNLAEHDYQILKAEKGASNTKCLIGPGTGLGLGFLVTGGAQPFVQKTHGGHMPVAVANEEEFKIMQHIQSRKTSEAVPIYEDFISGRGLYNIYSAVCALNEQEPATQSVEGLFKHQDTLAVQKTLELFHQFFGRFAANAVITANAYGGLYLTGGVLERLVAANLFDFEIFKSAFLIKSASSVAQALDTTPIILLKDPYPALKGLTHV